MKPTSNSAFSLRFQNRGLLQIHLHLFAHKYDYDTSWANNLGPGRLFSFCGSVRNQKRLIWRCVNEQDT